MKKIFFLLLLFMLSYSSVYAQDKEIVFLNKCIDGDTASFIINNNITKVRFLAIDTPEINKNEAYSYEAKDYTCQKLKEAKEIKLEYDITKQDKYNRLLAWIWIDNKLLQEELVKEGFAKIAYTYENYKYVDNLYKYQKEAIENKKRIWSDYQNTFTVKFIDKESVFIQYITENSFLSEPKPNTNILYSFKGWYKSDKKYDFNTPITNNLVLQAKYEINYMLIITLICTFIMIYLSKYIKIKIRRK